MENLKNRINKKLVSNQKDYLKCSSKPSYISHKIFDNNFAIRKSKLALKINKPAYIGMRIPELINVLMYKFHCDYINNKYDNISIILFTDTDSLMYKIKQKMSTKVLVAIKKCLIFVIIRLSQNTMIIRTN